MIITDAEAHTKWCSHGNPQNKNSKPPDHPIDWRLQTCLGAGCMNWQWVDDLKPWKGYCGLARSAPS